MNNQNYSFFLIVMYVVSILRSSSFIYLIFARPLFWERSNSINFKSTTHGKVYFFKALGLSLSLEINAETKITCGRWGETEIEKERPRRLPRSFNAEDGALDVQWTSA